MKHTRILRLVGATAFLGLAVSVGHAQWTDQQWLVRPGWTAIYFNVDASYVPLDQLVGSNAANPIVEIWYWQTPATPAQILPFQSQPMPSADWLSWVRAGYTNSPPGALGVLSGNAAYLVHSIATTNFLWVVRGKPVAPSYSWTSSGLNFIGFNTPLSGPPTFSTFLAPAPGLAAALQAPSNGQRAPGIYRYPGGALGSNNPALLPSLFWSSTPVSRGQAFWVDAGIGYNNNYFGPFQVTGLSSGGGVDLGDSGSQTTFTLRNVTSSNLTVTVRQFGSAAAPAGQPSVYHAAPVLLRGGLVASNLTYSAIPLYGGGSNNYSLAPQGQPGSQITVVMGVDRSLMTGPAGSLYASFLRFTDSLNLSQVDVPVTAQSASAAGLWVGKAAVSQVANYLKTYQVDQNNNPVTDTDGSYIVTAINTNLGPVPQSYPLRLILHNDGTSVVLLQHVFYGLDLASNMVVALHETALDPSQLGTARRISAANFPWTSTNQAWSCIGQLAAGTNLTVTVSLPYDDQASNPFLHTYHPDHDNLDATFQNKLPRGSESYDISRQITLSFSSPGSDFASLIAAGQILYGTYLETITVNGLGSASRTFNVTGSFTLNRISPIASLTRL
jgi:hypothetical protein